MIKCLLIDDEPLALKQLQAYVGKVPFLELAGSCHSALEASRVLAEQPVDAIFVDINMPDLNGMDFVKSLLQKPLTVFTTAYSEYAIEGYKVDAVDYLLKPFGLDDFTRAANKVLHQYQLIHQSASATEGIGDDRVLFLKSDYKMVRVDVDKIRYVEGMSEYLRLFLENEEKPVIALLSMKKLEDRLPKNKFMRVHRSYVVNLEKMEEVSKNRIRMDKNTYLPVGDLYKEAFNSYLESKSLTK